LREPLDDVKKRERPDVTRMRCSPYHDRPSAFPLVVTDFKEFPGRSRYTLGHEGWEEVADYALDWAVKAAVA
jgi:hypothetical protein